jgi:hypothetical protein
LRKDPKQWTLEFRGFSTKWINYIRKGSQVYLWSMISWLPSHNPNKIFSQWQKMALSFLGYRVALLEKHSWRLCSWTRASNTRSSTSSSPSPPSPSTQRWMKYIEGYSKSPSLVKRDGMTCVLWSIIDAVYIRVNTWNNHSQVKDESPTTSSESTPRIREDHSTFLISCKCNLVI